MGLATTTAAGSSIAEQNPLKNSFHIDRIRTLRRRKPPECVFQFKLEGVRFREGALVGGWVLTMDRLR